MLHKIHSFIICLFVFLLLMLVVWLPGKHDAFAKSAGTIVITSPEDSGVGTLRQALSDAQPGQIITFDANIFPPKSPMTIALESELPVILADMLMIDGSDAGVVLDGSHLSVGNGLTINGAYTVTIQGLQVLNFPYDGIKLVGGAKGAIIGGDRSIGSAPLGQANLLNNNSQAGIHLSGSDTSFNQILGNYIGTDITGERAVGNLLGVVVEAGASDNVIGGITPSTRNLISGNSRVGITLNHSGTNSNIIQGNYIGTDVTCTKALGNYTGIRIERSAGNIIGGENPENRNVISGNLIDGVIINGATENRVLGNYIGTDCDGIKKISNRDIGLRLAGGATNNIIGGTSAGARNIISGNGLEGLAISGASTSQNQIIGNYIGTDVSGTVPLSNTLRGIVIAQGATQNTVGGMTEQERNIISGNGETGVSVQGFGTTDNRIIGNYIGVDVTGSRALGNESGGVAIVNRAQDNIVGDTGLAGNIISGNGEDGITMQGNGTSGNQIRGNYIGTDATGTTALENKGAGLEISSGASNNVIGGDKPEDGNLISGNRAQGIWLEESSENQLLSNYIGTDRSGKKAIPNNIGVEIKDFRTTGNVISGTLIAFNHSAGILTQLGSQNIFQRNIVQGNGGVAAQVTLKDQLVGNEFFANEFNVVQIRVGTLYEDQTWERQGDLDTYLIVEDDLVIAPGATLTIAAGVNVQFDFGLGAQIEGTLIAEGSAEQPIHFTSAQRFANPLPGEWKGLTFAAGSTSSLAHSSVEFAENGLTLLNGATVSVISSTIAANEKHGIFVPAETLTFTLTLDQNAIAGNGQMAINNQSAIPISAPDSWWGSASGPHYAGNPDGQGDAVSAKVNIESWRRDSEAKDAWSTALVANLGRHHFMIDDHRSLHWFRIPMNRGGTLTVTLSHPQQDYDLFLFSNLEEPATLLDDLGDAEDAARGTKHVVREAKDILGNDTKGIGDGAGICSSRYIAQVANLGQANRGRLLRASCAASIGEEEVVSTDVWDQSGWYYLFVAGHNGANNNTISYTLDITLTEGTTGLDVDVEVPLFDPPESSQPGKKSIILTNEARLKERYQPNEVNALMNKLDQLANLPEVSGVVIDLGTYDQLDEVYESWDKNITDTVSANYVAASVKALLTSMRGAYPDLENILIVGNDEIIPFRRIPDEVTIANERNYSPPSIPPNSGGDSALMNNLRSGYFLSDDYYAGFDPIPYRGRGLFLPEYAQGRLVETPEEMMTSIDTFLQSPVLTVTSGLVTGYDFLIDQAEAIAQELEEGGLTPDTLISHSWQADNLKEKWLNTRHDLSSINAHFEHGLALPAERAGGDVSAADVQASDNLTGTVVFSVGCHSGLPVSGSDEGQLDFAQVLVGRGAMYVANTGYGYGDANAIGYSEHLMRLFVRHLRKGATVGQALAQAKREYFNTMGIEAVTPYDEKVLAVATFYGFPMYQVRMPNAPESDTTSARQAPSAQLGPLTTCPEGLTCRQATFTPIYATETVTDGTYFSVQGETEERLGQPILPRTSIEVFETRITNTFEITAARGVLFEGGDYDIYPDFNPAITRIITESTDHIAEEPPYFVEAWTPSERERISSLRTGDKITQRLVVMPAQYRSVGPDDSDYPDSPNGIARRFNDMTYTIYYSSAGDIILPSIWQVATTRQEESAQVEVKVEVTDFSGVVRTVATYTTGYGTWQSVDLERIGDSNIWQGYLEDHPTLDYLVQAVDRAGNVAVHDNKGRYFPPAAPASTIYLPIITR